MVLLDNVIESIPFVEALISELGLGFGPFLSLSDQYYIWVVMFYCCGFFFFFVYLDCALNDPVT